MSRTDPQLKVRLPLEMKEQLEAAAKENRRSMNAEIVARLEESIQSQVEEKVLIDGYTKQQLEEYGLPESLIEDLQALNLKVDSVISHFVKKRK